MTMKKFVILAAATFFAAGVSGAYAQGTTGSGDQTSHQKAKTSMKSGTTTGSAMKSSKKPMAGDNDELKGNNGNSAGGSNSLSNTNNPGGMGNNAGPPMR
jgi:hypothetical protein